MNRRRDDFEDEIREHIEMETLENIERGMSPDEARRAALRTFGNVGVVRERLREGSPLYWLETLWQDIRFGFRLLVQSPLLSLSIVLTLTLGIGINTGVFTVLNGMLLRSRVDQDPDRFAHVSAQYRDGGPSVIDWGVSTTDLRAYRANVQSLDHLAGWTVGRSTIGTDPTSWLIQPVTCNFFSLYGLDRARLGRLFTADECEQPDQAPVVLLGEELWRSRFQADPQIIGREIRLNRQPFTVVGVLPGNFAGQLRGPGIWVPYTMSRTFFGRDFFREDSIPWLTLEGRLKPGQTRASAQAELAIIAHQQDRLQPGRMTTIFVTNGSFVEEPAQRGVTIWIAPLILSALTLVLLLASTNVTMLLLARAAARQREIAIRLSLGAGRMRLIRMLLTESLLLAGASGLISLWIAWQTPRLLNHAIPGMPHYFLEPDLRVVAYLAGVTLLAGIIAGMAPALEALKVDLAASLKGMEGRLVSGRGGPGGFLVGAQVAMSLVLLAAAGLFLHAQETMLATNPGFDVRQVLLLSARMPMPPYNASSAATLDHELERRLQTVSGIHAVARASVPPFSGDESGAPLEEVRLPGQPKGGGLKVSANTVSPNFFTTLGIRITQGRAFSEGETARPGTPAPVVVSEALARSAWPGLDPVGRTLEDAAGNPLEVIGVAHDTHAQRIGVSDGPAIYRVRDPRASGDAILVRFRGEAEAASASVRQLVTEVAPDLEPHVEPLQSMVDRSMDSFSKVLRLVLILAALAVGLAVIGIYGVVAFSVNRRRREMAIRVAMGATRRDIIVTVLGSGLRPIAVGLTVGMAGAIAGAIAIERALRSTPLALNVGSPIPYAAVTLLLTATAVLAMLRPALGAAGADPIAALKEE